MAKNPSSKPVTGPAGLLMEAIHRATLDATSKSRTAEERRWRADARAFFAGPVYTSWLEMLDLDPSLLPAVFEEVVSR